MGREVFFPFPILSGLVNAMFCLRGLREEGKQSVGKVDPAASPQFSSSASSWLLYGKLAGTGESMPSLCTPSIKHQSVLDSCFQERIALIVLLENKIGEGEGDTSPRTLRLPWLRGSFSHPRLIFGIIGGFLNLSCVVEQMPGILCST